MNTSGAVAAWLDVLGTDYVITSESVLEQAETATFSTHQQVCAILRPGDRQQVQACLKIASEFAVPVYPISSGRNWGYGSRVPAQDGCAILDLARLNQIVEFNPELAYVTVEPGVTQRQLYEFLQQKQCGLWMDATGSSPECSLIGNAVERGFGHTPYGDHFAQICGMEVVLPSGEIIHTGFGRFPNAQATPVYRWGCGPYLDGLFSQSNFGIVTQLTIWLMPEPEYFQAFYFSAAQGSDLSTLIDALRPLRLDGTIKSAIHIGNDYKVLSSIQQYPWELAHDKTPLPPEVLFDFAKRRGFGAWNGAGALYGTRAQVAEARRLIRRALSGKVQRLQFLDHRLLRLAQWVAKPYQWLSRIDLAAQLRLVKPVYYLMQGCPTDTQIASTYWRKRIPVPTDPNPDRDRCGLMWCAPVAPLTGEHAQMIDQIAAEALAGQFEPMISMTLLTERVLGCLITIAYDREIPGEDERAKAAYEKLYQKLTTAGYYSYRLGIQSMESLLQGEASYTDLLQHLKNTIDPQHILAPGRYVSKAL
jgi:4-cresol dehydrogenase (hydroxylating) flavoprotein subunit